MKSYVQRWGNSLAICIPRVYADKLHLNVDSPVELTVVDGQLVIAPVAAPVYILEQLLADVTPNNLHGEIDTGFSLGNEFP